MKKIPWFEIGLVAVFLLMAVMLVVAAVNIGLARPNAPSDLLQPSIFSYQMSGYTRGQDRLTGYDKENQPTYQSTYEYWSYHVVFTPFVTGSKTHAFIALVERNGEQNYVWFVYQDAGFSPETVIRNAGYSIIKLQTFSVGYTQVVGRPPYYDNGAETLQSWCYAQKANGGPSCITIENK